MEANKKMVFPKEEIDKYAAGLISKNQLMNRIGLDAYSKYKKLIDAASDFNAMNCGNKKDMSVVYISGSSGSGKTTLAKYIAKKKHLSVFTSAGGKNLLDGYKQEECIILDDFRGSQISFSDLLKLLDNNTSSDAAARYHNVNMAFCKLIIITSIYQPNTLYYGIQQKEGEDFYQFIRRLDNECYYYIDDDNVIKQVDANTNTFTNNVMGNITILCPEVKKKTQTSNYFMKDLLFEADSEQEHDDDHEFTFEEKRHNFLMRYDPSYKHKNK